MINNTILAYGPVCGALVRRGKAQGDRCPGLHRFMVSWSGAEGGGISNFKLQMRAAGATLRPGPGLQGSACIPRVCRRQAQYFNVGFHQHVQEHGTAPVKCIEAATGNELWSKDGFGPGNLILVGDKLVVLSDKGELVLAQADPKEYRELGRFQAISGKCWSTPSLADGRLYVRSTKEAACFALP